MSVEGELTSKVERDVKEYQVAQLIHKILLTARSQTETQTLSTPELRDLLRPELPDNMTDKYVQCLIAIALSELHSQGLAELTTNRRHLALGREDQLVR